MNFLQIYISKIKFWKIGFYISFLFANFILLTWLFQGNSLVLRDYRLRMIMDYKIRLTITRLIALTKCSKQLKFEIKHNTRGS